MVIYVDHKIAVLKKGSSFDYISENRLFTGSDDYSLNITFPLKDCIPNISIFGHINRKDVSLGKVVFDCEICDRSFIKSGSVVVTEISDTEVKCQFLEGRSEQNFNESLDNIYINELKLGYPSERTPDDITPWNAMDALEIQNYVALPWVNNNSDSGLGHNFVDYDSATKQYVWSNKEQVLTWQPYLIYITEKIINALHYSSDLSEWRYHDWHRYILVCNTLPGAWDIFEFARALPHWTVEEYLSKLERFLGGAFKIDHRKKMISFSYDETISSKANIVCIDKVLDESNADVNTVDDDIDYFPNKNFKYKGDSSLPWKYYSCDWYIKTRSENAKVYNSFSTLRTDWYNAANNWYPAIKKNDDDLLNKLLYAKDIDRYFITIPLERLTGKWVTGLWEVSSKMLAALKPVNVFGPVINNEKSKDSEEFEFMPVGENYVDRKRGFCMFLEVGSFSEKDSITDKWPDSNTDTGPHAAILAGSEDGDDLPVYFDSIYLGLWRRPFYEHYGELPSPSPDGMKIFVNSPDYASLPFSLRLMDDGISHTALNKIDPKTKYTFKFISDNIPDARAIFLIRGKKYVCEKLTASFSESGLSQLIKGEFYRIENQSGS